MNRTRSAVSLAVVGVVAAALPTLTGGHASAHPDRHLSTTTAGRTSPPPSAFGGRATNRYFPLEPGTVTVLRGHSDGQQFRERTFVTHRTKMIQGVRTRVVRDITRRLDGSLSEKTLDWYATDNTGRVWYFGEATGTYDRHEHLINHDGSWEAGVDGAAAGKIMPAHPHPSVGFRQEFLRGEAEDQAWIVQNNARLTTPVGHFRHAVRDFEWSRLEPGVVSTKFYAPGVGLLLERDLTGGNEVFRLVSIHRR
ncbi:hypothetical protein [Nocardioides sp.]|jgi:hypothetical protein|uniref:hypothetical protein n=1 Tax=Nocardioides sp. TaxID=35761 RepID=UPI0031FF243F|nr:hypothetical protein [Nocardioides sp.]